MNDKLGEEFSALVDGEMSEFGLRKVLSELDDKPEMIDKWERYHLARGVFRQETLFCDDLNARVGKVLADEPPLMMPAATQKTEKPLGMLRDKFYKPLSTVALVTFVSVASVTAWQSLSSNNSAGDSLIAVNGPEMLPLPANDLNKTVQVKPRNDRNMAETVSNGDIVVSNPPASVYLSPQRLKVYMVSHANHAAAMNSSGIMPFARVVSTQSK